MEEALKHLREENHFKSRDAHNVVVVEPVENDECPGTFTTYAIEKFEASADGGLITATARYNGKGTSYVWERTIVLSGNRLKITDTLRAGKIMETVLHLHLAPGNARNMRNNFVAKGKGWQVSGECISAKNTIIKPVLRSRLAIDEKNKPYKGKDLCFYQSGRNVKFDTTIKFNSERKK